LEFHSDNGSEFINNATEIWCENENLPFTRSRDHKKNDNCLRTFGPSRTKKRRRCP
jgi:hypothetical protein